MNDPRKPTLCYCCSGEGSSLLPLRWVSLLAFGCQFIINVDSG